jgi:transcriptional regulator with XRE-family HTH domain
MMGVRERLKAYLKHNNISQSAFAEAIGASAGYVNAIAKSIGPDKIPIIKSIFTDLNIDWLLTGEGSMLKNTDQPVSQGGEDATLSEADLNNSNTMKKYLDQVLRQNEELIRQNGVLLDLFREERAKNKGEVALKKEG